MTISDLLVDTNVLIYAALPASQWHSQAKAALEKHRKSGRRLWVSRQIVREFCRVMLSQEDNAGLLARTTVVAKARYILDRYLVAEDSPEITAVLLKMIEDIDFRARALHDANLVATMRHYGIPAILTNDPEDFAAFTSIVEVIPLGST